MFQHPSVSSEAASVTTPSAIDPFSDSSAEAIVEAIPDPLTDGPLAVSLDDGAPLGALGDYALVFEHPEPTLQGNVKTAISTSGTYLVSIADTDNVSILDVKGNRHVGRLNFESNGSRVSAVCWFSDNEILLGTFVGQVFAARILKDQTPCPESKQIVDIALLLHRTRETIVDLAYDPTSSLLAYIHTNVLLVLYAQPNRPYTFKHPLFARIPSYFNVGAKQGFVIWTMQSDTQSITWHGFETFEITNFAVSPDLSYICGSSVDSTIHIWPMGPSGPAFDQVRTFCMSDSLPNGLLTSLHFVSDIVTPPLVALTNRIIAVDIYGYLHLALSNGERIDTTRIGSSGSNPYQIHCVQSYDNMIYLTVEGPNFKYRTMAFTNNHHTLNKFLDLHRNIQSTLGDDISCKRTEQQVKAPVVRQPVQKVKTFCAQASDKKSISKPSQKSYLTTELVLLLRLIFWGYIVLSLAGFAIAIHIYSHKAYVSYNYKNNRFNFNALVFL
ncbi:transmembrane protein, putative, partial [Rhizoctonia solani AG-3 Rhs1AP]